MAVCSSCGKSRLRVVRLIGYREASMRCGSFLVFWGGGICCLGLSGCAMWPYKDRHVIATRTEMGTTNAVEWLVQSDTGIAGWAMLKPCYAGPEVQKAAIHRSFFVRSKEGKRTDLEHFDFLKETFHPDWTGRVDLWYGGYWKIRPVMGTNLWVAMIENSDGNERGRAD